MNKLFLLMLLAAFLFVLYMRARVSMRRLQGLLESEQLKKEVLRKENNFAFLSKEETEKKLKRLEDLVVLFTAIEKDDDENIIRQAIDEEIGRAHV